MSEPTKSPNKDDSATSSSGTQRKTNSPLKKLINPTDVPIEGKASSPPRTSGKQDDNSSGTEHLYDSISQILGVKLANWPYSQDSLNGMVQLRTEQEKTKQEETRHKNLMLSLELLNCAKNARVPPELIPCFFVEPPKEVREKIDYYVTSFKNNPPPVQTQPQQGGRRDRGGAYQDMYQQQQMYSQPLSQAPNLQKTPIYEYPDSGRQSLVSSPVRAPQQPSSTKRGISPSRPSMPSHHRSHTTTGIPPSFTGSTSVWKVNLPQQQQYQFHHWSGPDSKDTNTSETPASTSSSIKRKLSGTKHEPSPSPLKGKMMHSAVHKRNRSDGAALLSSTSGSGGTGPLGSPYVYREHVIVPPLGQIPAQPQFQHRHQPSLSSLSNAAQQAQSQASKTPQQQQQQGSSSTTTSAGPSSPFHPGPMAPGGPGQSNLRHPHGMQHFMNQPQGYPPPVLYPSSSSSSGSFYPQQQQQQQQPGGPGQGGYSFPPKFQAPSNSSGSAGSGSGHGSGSGSGTGNTGSLITGRAQRRQTSGGQQPSTPGRR
ncbi:unnamed protein product [Ambrosiozyma monospora]|uniref:Unnamed protein product n=1 Tax=Ambrosiozyma monospora TaxID=43982 RepID=A0ACB5T2F1_AMBMO|nr:unnamed protein product [Ambrosiozyma monospora]